MTASLRTVTYGVNVLAEATAEVDVHVFGIQVLWSEVPSIAGQGTLGDYAEAEILDQLFNKQQIADQTFWVGFSQQDPSESGDNLLEPVGDTYTRMCIGDNWSDVTGGIVSNTADITFPVVNTSWGTLTHIVLFDASSGGHVMASGALSSEKDMTMDEYAYFRAGSIVVRMT